MKKTIILAGICATLLASCGTTGTTGLLGGATGTATNPGTGLLGAAGGNATTSIVGSVLSSLLGASTTTQASLVGSWTYSEPAVSFESNNVLAQLGGSVASTKIQSTMASQLSKLGFKAGATTFVFNSDGTMTYSIGTKQGTGTYKFDKSSGKMTLTGALGVTNITCYAVVSGNTLQMLFDADKILALATGISGKTSATSSISQLLNSYTGMKLGWAMVKK